MRLRGSGLSAVVMGASMVALSLITACSSGPVAEAGSAVPALMRANGVQQITVQVGDEMKFDPQAISVKAGVPVELTLVGSGNSEHDFSLNEGVSSPVKILAKGQESAIATFTIDRPGAYSFFCSVPGHAFAGMRGSIIVVEG